MSTEDVMSTWEYREERRDGFRPLLDHEGMPREDVPTDSTALARLASVIYLNARELTPEQLANAICWLKTWKIDRTSPARRGFSEFSAVLDGLRNNPEQADLQKRARRYLLGSRMLTVVLSLCGLVFLLHISSGNGRW
ncbi:hypothetical protein LJ655_08965 [Paraburkholderia sp. MMS20-SJTN17]|uniref:DotU family type IV/VI secretion system protein n=1 Tax=Paraburkholderia translucens TaxID=2886945 RepID=A0ABS8KBC0_9BURK|nr:hypothetical protein [Paraburkholderia sp. MMS20-SJTN17]MCC8402022.1 hypothetical protein [Paraburkholderia sp. MMS20-SJTN17]